jgi:hypothetical protein
MEPFKNPEVVPGDFVVLLQRRTGAHCLASACYYRVDSTSTSELIHAYHILGTRIHSDGTEGLGNRFLVRWLKIPSVLTTHEHRVAWMKLQGIQIIETRNNTRNNTQNIPRKL